MQAYVRIYFRPEQVEFFRRNKHEARPVMHFDSAVIVLESLGAPLLWPVNLCSTARWGITMGVIGEQRAQPGDIGPPARSTRTCSSSGPGRLRYRFRRTATA